MDSSAKNSLNTANKQNLQILKDFQGTAIKRKINYGKRAICLECDGVSQYCRIRTSFCTLHTQASIVLQL